MTYISKLCLIILSCLTLSNIVFPMDSGILSEENNEEIEDISEFNKNFESMNNFKKSETYEDEAFSKEKISYKNFVQVFFNDPNCFLAFISAFLPSTLSGYLTNWGYKKWVYVPALAASWWLTHHFAQKIYESDDEYWDIKGYKYTEAKTNMFWTCCASAGLVTGEGLRLGRNSFAQLWYAYVSKQRN